MYRVRKRGEHAPPPHTRMFSLPQQPSHPSVGFTVYPQLEYGDLSRKQEHFWDDGAPKRKVREIRCAVIGDGNSV